MPFKDLKFSFPNLLLLLKQLTEDEDDEGRLKCDYNSVLNKNFKNQLCVKYCLRNLKLSVIKTKISA